jgi:hypothetical protein
MRVDFGDSIVDYDPAGLGAHHQLRGTFGLGVWF